MKIKQLIEA